MELVSGETGWWRGQRTSVYLLPLDTPKLPFRFRPAEAIGGTSASLAGGPEAAPQLSTSHCRPDHA
jgi:hypothetical protein